MSEMTIEEAEEICREWLPVGRDGEAIYRVMAEYDQLRLAEKRALAVRDSSSDQRDVYNVGLNVAARLVLGTRFEERRTA